MLQAVGSQRDPTQRLSRSKVLAEEESRMLVPLRAAHGTQPEGLRVQSCCSRGRGVLPFSGWIVSGHFVYMLRVGGPLSGLLAAVTVEVRISP